MSNKLKNYKTIQEFYKSNNNSSLKKEDFDFSQLVDYNNLVSSSKKKKIQSHIKTKALKLYFKLSGNCPIAIITIIRQILIKTRFSIHKENLNWKNANAV